MFGSNRLHDLAVRGWLIVFLAIGIPALAAPPDSPGNPATAQEDTGERQPNPTPQQGVPIEVPISPEIIGPTGTDLSDAQDRAEDAKRKEEHDKADLKAQQEMAIAAEKMLWATVASVGVAAVAVVLVFLTFRVTRKTAERQLRAYLAITEANRIKVDRPGRNGWSVHVVVKNYGQTPAYNTRITVYSDVKPRGFDETQLDITQHKKESVPFYFPPNDTNHTTDPLPRLDTGWNDFKNEKSAAYIWGRIDYTDAFKKERWATFRMYSNYFTGLEFAYCPTGNDAN